MKDKLTIIYVMGVFRSGSTIFDTLLGNFPVVESVGELVNVYSHAWLEGHYCACGELGNECPFWVAVRDDMFSCNPDPATLTAIYRNQERVERFKRWPLLLLQKIKKTKAFKEYEKNIFSLFDGIANVSGKSIIVDSSKNPGRALALSMVDGVDLKVIHLVRDGRGVAWSCLKPYAIAREQGLQVEIIPTPIWKTSVRWTLINFASTIVGKIIGFNYMRVHYEDMVADHELTFKKVGSFADIDTRGITELVEGQEEIKVGHTIAGNRVRMQKNIELKPDVEWVDKLDDGDQRTFWLIGGWLARLYGYIR